MKKRLGELRLADEFVTPTTGLEGVVMDWGYTRSYRQLPGNRPHLPTVVVELEVKGGWERRLWPPETIVIVGEDHLNWPERHRPTPEERWKGYVGDSEEDEE